MVANGGILEKAMKEVKPPYSKGYIKSHKIKNQPGWKELVDKYFPDTKLAKKHGELLNAESETVQLGAVKLGYEVGGKLLNVLPTVTSQTLNINFFSNPKLMQATKAYDEQLKQALFESYDAKRNLETLQDK